MIILSVFMLAISYAAPMILLIQSQEFIGSFWFTFGFFISLLYVFFLEPTLSHIYDFEDFVGNVVCASYFNILFWIVAAMFVSIFQ